MWGFSKWKCEDMWLHVKTWKIYFDRYTHAKPWFVTHQTMNVKNNLDEVKKSCSNLLIIFNIQTWLFWNQNWFIEILNRKFFDVTMKFIVIRQAYTISTRIQTVSLSLFRWKELHWRANKLRKNNPKLPSLTSKASESLLEVSTKKEHRISKLKFEPRWTSAVNTLKQASEIQPELSKKTSNLQA